MIVTGISPPASPCRGLWGRAYLIYKATLFSHEMKFLPVIKKTLKGGIRSISNKC